MGLVLSMAACSSSSADAKDDAGGSNVRSVDPTTSAPTSTVDTSPTTATVPPTSEPASTVPETQPRADPPGLARRTTAGIDIGEEAPVFEDEATRSIGATSGSSRVAIDIPGDWVPPADGADMLVWVGDDKIGLVVFETGPEVAVVRAVTDGRTLDETEPVDRLAPLAIKGDLKAARYSAYRADGTEVTTCGSDAEVPSLLTCS